MNEGFLRNKKGLGGKEAAPAAQQGDVEWSAKTLDAVVRIFCEVLQEQRTRADVNRRVRMGTGKPLSRGQPLPTEPDWVTDLIAGCMKPRALADLAPKVLEKAEKVRAGMLKKAKAEGLVMGKDEEEQVRMDILKESLIRELVNACHQAAAERGKNRSTDGGLLALPAGWQGACGLDTLSTETVGQLMSRGWAVQTGWLGEKAQKAMLDELEMMDCENKMEETHQQRIAQMRWAKVAWQDVSDLDRQKQPRLRELFEKTIALPFELNKKCGNLLLQASGLFEVCCYTVGGFYRVHMDGSRDPSQENGRKISVMYFPGAGWRTKDAGQVRLWPRVEGDALPEPGSLGEPALAMKPAGDALVLWMSRDIPMEIQETQRKLFAIGFHINGPQLDKDRKQ